MCRLAVCTETPGLQPGLAVRSRPKAVPLPRICLPCRWPVRERFDVHTAESVAFSILYKKMVAACGLEWGGAAA